MVSVPTSQNFPCGVLVPEAPEEVSSYLWLLTRASMYLPKNFSSSSFILPSFVWFCVFFSHGSGTPVLSAGASASTSVSEGVFLMYLWREMYSTFTYSSAILVLQICLIFFCLYFEFLYLLVYLACVLQYVQITYMDNDVFVDSLGFSLYNLLCIFIIFCE